MVGLVGTVYIFHVGNNRFLGGEFRKGEAKTFSLNQKTRRESLLRVLISGFACPLFPDRHFRAHTPEQTGGLFIESNSDLVDYIAANGVRDG